MRGWGWPTWAGLTRLREGQWTEAGWGWPGASSSVVEHLESRITITSYTIIHTHTRNLSLSTPTEHSLTTLFTSHQSRSSPSPSSLLTLTSIMSHDPSLLTLTLPPHTHHSHSPSSSPFAEGGLLTGDQLASLSSVTSSTSSILSLGTHNHVTACHTSDSATSCYATHHGTPPPLTVC